MAREPRNIGASVRARLLDRARAAKIDFRFSSRATRWSDCSTASPSLDLRERFVLMGAMLFAIWRDDPFRPTRDLDLLGNGDVNYFM
jgi:hypothetical protein